MARGGQFIFVGGAARSGTTMVQNVLDSHPDIIGGPQFRNIPDIVDLRKKLHESIEIGKTGVFNSCEDIDTQICLLIENLLFPLLKQSNRKYLSEKTPTNIFVFPELMELFSDARFLYVIRDPRAVISSNLVARRKFKEEGIAFSHFSGERLSDFITLANSIKKAFLAGEYATTIPPENFFTVVYERLVHNPENETKKICKFLGIEWSSQMLYPSRQTHIGEEGMTRTKLSWHTKEGTFDRDIDASSVDKWKKELNPIQKAIISFIFRDLESLTCFDYDLLDYGWKERVVYRVFLIYKNFSSAFKIFNPILIPLMKLRIGSSSPHH